MASNPAGRPLLGDRPLAAKPLTMLHETTTLYYVTDGNATAPASQWIDGQGMAHYNLETAMAHAQYCQEDIANGRRDSFNRTWYVKMVTECVSRIEVPAYEPLNAWVLVRYWPENGGQKRRYAGEQGFPVTKRKEAKRFESLEAAYQWTKSTDARDLGPYYNYEAIYM